LFDIAMVAIALCLAGSEAAAQGRSKRIPPGAAAAGRPADYRSAHFLIHTDVSPERAAGLLKKLETMLRLISEYWGRPSSGIIEMYVVEDLANWPDAAVRFRPEGLAQIRAGGGVCLTERLSSGNRFIAKSIVYASAARGDGTAQHEAVHAYCGQTFGSTGPTWYAEGMAEMGQYWQEGRSDVNADPHVIKYLRSQPPKPLAETVQTFDLTGDTWQDYAWRWALCHLLANNPNYAPQFRPLGLGLLLNQNVSFEQVYGPVARRLEFEYHFFLAHLAQGYRADLCAWDWKRQFRSLDNTSRALTTRILADRGWQPAAVRVSSGTEYEYAAEGRWNVAKEGESVDADGAAEGRGRLEGVLFRDFRLSRPFSLGTYGSFKFAADGDLYLRCGDDWASLADHSGHISVKIKVKGRGSPLKKPD
jgi:hypothetical protein